MSFGVHPFILMAAVGVVVALAAIVIAWKARSGLVTAIMVVLALVFMLPAAYVFLAFHPELVDGRFRTYKAFYRNIQVGLTRDQVLGVMERHYPSGGPRQRPRVVPDDTEELGFVMNPESSREPNCEGIMLKLVRGRVVAKEYRPD